MKVLYGLLYPVTTIGNTPNTWWIGLPRTMIYEWFTNPTRFYTYWTQPAKWSVTQPRACEHGSECTCLQADENQRRNYLRLTLRTAAHRLSVQELTRRNEELERENVQLRAQRRMCLHDHRWGYEVTPTRELNDQLQDEIATIRDEKATMEEAYEHRNAGKQEKILDLKVELAKANRLLRIRKRENTLRQQLFAEEGNVQNIRDKLEILRIANLTGDEVIRQLHEEVAKVKRIAIRVFVEKDYVQRHANVEVEKQKVAQRHTLMQRDELLRDRENRDRADFGQSWTQAIYALTEDRLRQVTDAYQASCRRLGVHYPPAVEIGLPELMAELEEKTEKMQQKCTALQQSLDDRNGLDTAMLSASTYKSDITMLSASTRSPMDIAMLSASTNKSDISMLSASTYKSDSSMLSRSTHASDSSTSDNQSPQNTGPLDYRCRELLHRIDFKTEECQRLSKIVQGLARQGKLHVRWIYDPEEFWLDDPATVGDVEEQLDYLMAEEAWRDEHIALMNSWL